MVQVYVLVNVYVMFRFTLPCVYVMFRLLLRVFQSIPSIMLDVQYLVKYELKVLKGNNFFSEFSKQNICKPIIKFLNFVLSTNKTILELF